MPPHARTSSGDSLAAGRGRQRIKLGALAYYNARHGIDADEKTARAARMFLRKMAFEFSATIPDGPKNRRFDLLDQGNDEMLVMAAIAYASCRHGVDADVGLAREALAMLCQESINFTESLPMEEMQKRPAVHLHLGNGARP